MILYPYRFGLPCPIFSSTQKTITDLEAPKELYFFVVIAKKLDTAGQNRLESPVFRLLHLSLHERRDLLSDRYTQNLLPPILRQVSRFCPDVAAVQVCQLGPSLSQGFSSHLLPNEEPTGVPAASTNCDPHHDIKHGSSDTKLLAATVQQLHEYLCGQRQVFDLPLLLLATPFQQRAWQQLRQIPYGQTASYQQQAAACGNVRACRAVGMANHNNPLILLLPCHRVLGKNGKLRGYLPGIHYKKYFLELEQRSLVHEYTS